MVTSWIPNIGQLVKSPWFLANISRFGGIPFLYLVMLKIPRFGSFRTIFVGWSRQIWDGRAALMSLFRWWIPQNDNFILRILHCPNLRSTGTYFVCAPHESQGWWIPAWRKKTNCRSKGKILWTSQVQLPCGPSCWSCFTMKFWEVSTWHRFRNSSWQSSLRYPIDSRSPELQQPSPAEPDGIVPWHQDRAAWGVGHCLVDI